MEEKPIVILSCDIDEDDRLRMRQEYFRAIDEAGGVPVVMPPFLERSKIDEWIGRVGAKGLLLTGGSDIDPQFYGELPLPGLGRVSLGRDAYEAELFGAAMSRGLAVLGICRGLQLVNVALGGSLYQDMASQMGEEFALHDQSASSETAVHEVALTPGTLTAELFGGERMVRANSHHHQCVRVVADGLTVAATTVDGVVEALEMPERNIVAVQFHPERMTETDPLMSGFFRNWVARIG